ncbi:S8 family serine peptidase [Bifidobacterium ruminantium]|uniref:S8 family serine peptidase n=1 Tax=Bifidobacterium ruminantium TaxID=78346 RepID=UPI001EF43D51|nr:S8 family serine peptidase [Bifidobacterium ruminantium]
MKRRLKGLLSVAAVAACAGLCAPSALASDDGVDWRIEDMGVRDAWASGITGEGVTVAVIDSQVVADHPSLEGVDVEYRLASENGDSCWYSQFDKEDRSRVMRKPGDVTLSTSDGFYDTHGTSMVGLIAGNGKGYDGGMGLQGIAPGAHVIAYPDGFTDKGTTGGMAFQGACIGDDGSSSDLRGSALADAVDSGARVVNMSYTTMPDWGYAPVALHAIRHGVVLVRGRDNSTRAGLYDLVGQPVYGQYFPGSVTVNSLARDGSISKYSDVMDGNVSILSPGVGVPIHKGLRTDSREVVFSEGGTSSAAADLTGYLALVFQKWPEATGNQVLQSLVRNTRGNGSGEARLDPEHKRGFGAVDLGKLLSVDPTVYPDVNPLLEWAVKASGEHEETKGMYTDSYSDLKDEYTSRLGDVFSPDGEQIECSKACGLIGREYERERKAWERVEQCRKDGGSDCMRYSATATADEADREAGWDDVKADYGRGGVSKSSSKSSLPSWFVPAVVGGSVLLVVLLVGGVVLAVVFLGRCRRSRAGSGSVPGGGPASVPGGVPSMPSVPAGHPMPGAPYVDIARTGMPHPNNPTHNNASRVPPTTGAHPGQRPPLPPSVHTQSC